jgi:3-dehydroquinate dehydratase-2
MKIAIINGPNLNLVGIREPEIYGNENMDIYMHRLMDTYSAHQFTYFQSNIEGEIIDEIQARGFDADVIIINAGGYTHTSVAIADAVKAVPAVAIEVHLSNIYARESFRQQSFLSPVCRGTISGFGLKSYELAVLSLS